jgi:hypothetical protein
MPPYVLKQGRNLRGLCPVVVWDSAIFFWITLSSPRLLAAATSLRLDTDVYVGEVVGVIDHWRVQ